ncbi:transcription factor FapR [Sporosarcina cyprini]|uniref:transcription factor FapR n=1 Tax=Sporosarcina cyprini TaxID=2910523 RepID=UPI001EDE059A|nr:transcription factor FapR [Sporosarcina cyprini]MCG3090137.1 transcription factor FapR [Sporosarcina cyprini]
MRIPKKERQHRLGALLDENPFMTDEELSKHFRVSVQTIRLDRLECGIPELRERLKSVATRSLEAELKSMQSDEVFGEIVDIELDRRAVSIFDVTSDHVFQRSGIARGHHLFAQANSLAVAVLDDDLALTVDSKLHFHRPVRAGDRVIARAIVNYDLSTGRRTVVEITSSVENELVFSGEFQMYRSGTDTRRESN